MNLTKDRVNALEGYLSAPDIALPSEEKEALHIAAALIEFWKSQQPKEPREIINPVAQKRCKHCGETIMEHVEGRCIDSKSEVPKFTGTTYEE